jgi:hypothetical protein
MAAPSCARLVAEHTSATAGRPRPGVATPLDVAVYWSLGGRERYHDSIYPTDRQYSLVFKIADTEYISRFSLCFDHLNVSAFRHQVEIMTIFKSQISAN